MCVCVCVCVCVYFVLFSSNMLLLIYHVLTDVIDKDTDTQCKTLAVQALVLLENIIKQVIHGSVLLLENR